MPQPGTQPNAAGGVVPKPAQQRRASVLAKVLLFGPNK
jgi:hypothetical protein